MRVVRLCLLGFVAWLLGVIVLFPAAPVVQRIEPQLANVSLAGVSGRLFSGQIDTVNYDDGLLPVTLTDLEWTFDPLALVQGTGASVDFAAYGGRGAGHVVRTWGGDLQVSDFTMTADARQLESLLPVPVVRFSGALEADIQSLRLQDELLTELEGTVSWSDAVIEQALNARLGDVNLQIVKDGPESHVVTVASAGGEVTINGTVNVAQDGDFAANLLLEPTPQASAEVIDSLRRIARPEANGRYRLQQSGNVNNLM